MKKKCISYIVILSTLVYICFASGCYWVWLYRGDRQEYHENVEDLERYILDELGGYIHFYGFDSDCYYPSSSKFSGRMAVLYIAFDRRYINNEYRTTLTSPISIIERIRILYNKYIHDHNNKYLEDCIVSIHIEAPRSSKPPSYRFAEISNLDFETWQPSGKELTTVELYNSYYGEPLSFAYGEWDYFYDCSDIVIACMNESTLDQIIEVADNMPFLKYIAVRDHYTVHKASELRPDVKFVSLK